MSWHIPRRQRYATSLILIPLKWLGANFWFLQSNLRIRKMCWLHPGLAFKLPCVLLSLFMISVTLASLPCHLTNCCPGVYGQVSFPNVSNFSGACPETISFYGVVREMECFQQGKASLLPGSACVCLQKLRVCKARQPSSITAGRIRRWLRVTHLLTAANLYFVVLQSSF